MFVHAYVLAYISTVISTFPSGYMHRSEQKLHQYSSYFSVFKSVVIIAYTYAYIFPVSIKYSIHVNKIVWYNWKLKYTYLVFGDSTAYTFEQNGYMNDFVDAIHISVIM